MLLKTDRDGNDSVPTECRWKRQQSVLHCIRTVTMYLLYVKSPHSEGLGDIWKIKRWIVSNKKGTNFVMLSKMVPGYFSNC